MIYIHNAQTIDGNIVELSSQSKKEINIDASGLTVFPGLIDPHVHFRTPGLEHKEDWRTAAKAAIAGGYTTVFDMPNTIPPTITVQRLHDKFAIIDAQLKEVDIPLRYQLFFGADKDHLNQIAPVAKEIIGIKVFMGCSTGNLVIDDEESLHAVFEIAAKNHLLVAVHAEDEHMLHESKNNYKGSMNYDAHSQIRTIEVACCAVEKAINLTKKYGTRLYILHVSSKQELTLIKQAKNEGLPVFAETTPHHLFLDTSCYDKLKGFAVVNPPLRLAENRNELLNAIHEGTIDTIGSDHAPHTISEKSQPYGSCPSGMPGIETMLPLLLNAYHAKLISLQEIISLTSTRAKHIFNLPDNNDIVLVDLNKEKIVDEKNLKTKCGWSSFKGQMLKGWPVYTIFEGHCFNIEKDL